MLVCNFIKLFFCQFNVIGILAKVKSEKLTFSRNSVHHKLDFFAALILIGNKANGIQKIGMTFIDLQASGDQTDKFLFPNAERTEKF